MAACILNLEVVFWLRYLLGVINSFQCAVSTLGNITVIWIFIKDRRLRTRSNCCLLSLAINDFLVGSVLEPLHVIQFFSAEYRNNCTLNSARRYLSTMLIGASIGSIAVISYDRYMHLSKTVNYRDHMTRFKVAILLSVTWLGPITIPIIRISSEAVYKIFIVLYIISIFIIIFTCYLFIIRIVKNRRAFVSSSGDTDRKSASDIRVHIRTARAIILIIAFFVATFTPIAVFLLASGLSILASSPFSRNASEIGYAVLITIVMVNSGINPLIYYRRIPEFRTKLRACMQNLRQTGKEVGSCESKDLGLTGTDD